MKIMLHFIPLTLIVNDMKIYAHLKPCVRYIEKIT